ncbi:MAG: phosphoglucosamine mutase, partial [Gammaproteobacteria bacterium]|nr:phosphoglucosamine mutase [Gammaproteobacteria bacterium]
KALNDAQKSLGEKGRVLLRSSGTEPVVRVMVEGESESIVNQTAQSLATVVKEAFEKA